MPKVPSDQCQDAEEVRDEASCTDPAIPGVCDAFREAE